MTEKKNSKPKPKGFTLRKWQPGGIAMPSAVVIDRSMKIPHGMMVEALAVVAEDQLKQKSKPEPLRVNIKQLAKILGKSESTVFKWKEDKIIPFEKIGRNVMYVVADVHTALQKYKRKSIGS